MARLLSSSRLWLATVLLVFLTLPSSRAADVKTDLDADISRDGIIDDDDPKDNGYVQNNPPGLPVTVGTLEKLVLRRTPKSMATGYVRLSIVSSPGAWKALKNPRWRFRPRPADGGHIRVWKDRAKTALILDSHDLAKQTIVWRLTHNTPMALVPPALYAEGVVPSKEPGDVSLVLEYGPTSRTAKSTRDIMVTTVRKAPLVGGGITRDEPGGAVPAVDLIGDVNRDGMIDPGNPADNGEAEARPAGLPVVIGSLERVSLRCVPTSPTAGYVRLTILSGPGEWEGLQDPMRVASPRRPAGGHVRVWADPERRKLILDSHVGGRMDVVWALSEEFPVNRIPTPVYAEGVAASREDGDVVLVLGYGPTKEMIGRDGPQDILVTTVPPAEPLADLVGDINRDGTIAPADPADNGEAEDKPTGLPVAIGTLEKLVLRCVPKSRTEGYVRFTIVSGPGEWENLQDPANLARPRRPAGGHVRVWQDPEKKTLILDSHDPQKMMVVWALSPQFPVESVPTTVYAEGLAVSRADGDVALVLGYGSIEKPDGPDTLRDILVVTVGKARLLRGGIARGPVSRGGVNAEQLAIWTFDGSPAFAHGKAMAPTTEDVAGMPSMTMLNADIDPNGKGGTPYTDVESVYRAATRAAAWDDIKKNNAPDAEFRVGIATTGWKDIEVRFDYKSESADNFRLDYSIDDGTQWTPATAGPISLQDGYTWQALPFVDLTAVAAIENLPSVIFRFYDLSVTGNNKFVFDNLEFIGDRIPQATGPTIEVAATTTTYLKLPAQNQGYVSGVIGDPTDPARTLGIDFIIADPDTLLNQLTVTAVSVPNANYPAQVQLALTGTGANRNLKITPLVIGYADINVKVADGTDSATYVILYAASGPAPNPTAPRFHTGVSDVSAATAIDANTMLVANDEDRSLWLYHRGDSGLFVKEIDTTVWPGLTAPWLGLTTTRETDIEGCARDGARAYWIGSHGNNSSGQPRDNRCRLFATTISGSGNQATVAPVGWYGNLRTDLIAWDVNNLHGKGANYYGLKASAAQGIEPKRDDGFNIEGLAMGSNSATVYVGFRAPIVPAPIVPAPIVPADRGTKALVVPVTNVQALVSGDPSTGPATLGPPIELDLGGRGVRSMARTASGGYLIVAGPTTNATGTPPSDFRLYSWSGNPLAAPALLQNDLTGLSTGGSFEAIVEPTGGVGGTIQLLNDNGTTDWYGDRAESKTLNANWQKFRSDRVTPGAPVPATPFSMTIGGTGDDAACSAVHTLDGGSIVVGRTSSTGAGKLDLWVCKLDGSGNVEWQRTYGGAENDCFRDMLNPPCIRQTLDGGYIVATSTASFGAGDTDVWVLRLASDGGIVWQKTYGGEKQDVGNAVAVCSDGSFVVGCSTNSFGPGRWHMGRWDMWILKLTAGGTVLWQSVYSRRPPRRLATTHLAEIEEMAGGELLVTGRSFAYPCLLKLSPTGALRWAIDYGGLNYQQSQNGAQPTSDGGCIVVSGCRECCVEKIDGNGKTVWRKTYVGPGKVGEDETLLLCASGIDETPDRGYIIGTVAYSTHNRGAVPASTNQVLLRVDSNGDPVWCRSYESVFSADEVPHAGQSPDMSKRSESLTACPDGTYLMVGKSGVSKTTGRDMLILKVKADGTVPGFDTPLFPVNGESPPPKDRDGIEMDAQTTTVTGVDTHVTAADSLISPKHVRD